jgi:hypothetical protein
MIKLRIFLIPATLAIILTSCPYGGYKYNTGFLPTSPVNLADFNTQYDDYNMSAPTIDELMPIYFSSNRNSAGNDFDIVLEFFEIQFDKDNGGLYSGRQKNDWYYQYDSTTMFQILETINTSNNELGPSVTYIEYAINPLQYNESNQYLVLWANDQEGYLDIMVTHNHSEGESDVPFIDPLPVKYLNTANNDTYPTIDFDRNQILFCSDRGQDFDIYLCDLPADKTFVEALVDSVISPEILLSEELSSSSDDKCPSINFNVLVFTSDRPGGEGGFDLWYSIKEGTGWSEPENFGPHVNTEHDEYRPIIIYLPEFQHDMLMFSSDRPGGKGGFDLYFVGVKQMVEPSY